MFPLVPLAVAGLAALAMLFRRTPKAPVSPTAGMVDNPQGPFDTIVRDGTYAQIPAGSAVPSGWTLVAEE